MKFRLDFVTNSSSSSFVCYNIYSIELYELVKKLIDTNKFLGKEECYEYHLERAWETLSLIESNGLYGVSITDESRGSYSNDYYSAQELLNRFFEDLSQEEKQDISDFIEISFLYRNVMFTEFKDQTDGYCGYSFYCPSKQIYERILKIKHDSLFFEDESDEDTICVDCEYVRKNKVKEIEIPSGYKYFKLMYNNPPYGFKTRKNGYDKYDSSINCVEKFVFSDDIISVKRKSGYPPESKNTGLDVFSNLKEIVLGHGISVLPRKCFNDFEALEKINIPSSVCKIELGVFFDCKSLKKVVIEDGVTGFEKSAFANCYNATFICNENSEAYNYVIENHLKVAASLEEYETITALPKKNDIFSILKDTSLPIVNRGIKLLQDGKIVDFSNEGTTYKAIANGRGSKYNLFVELDGDEIKDMDCSCPYDTSRVCKHLVALMLKVLETNGQSTIEFCNDVTEKMKK